MEATPAITESRSAERHLVGHKRNLDLGLRFLKGPLRIARCFHTAPLHDSSWYRRDGIEIARLMSSLVGVTKPLAVTSLKQQPASGLSGSTTYTMRHKICQHRAHSHCIIKLTEYPDETYSATCEIGRAQMEPTRSQGGGSTSMLQKSICRAKKNGIEAIVGMTLAQYRKQCHREKPLLQRRERTTTTLHSRSSPYPTKTPSKSK